MPEGLNNIRGLMCFQNMLHWMAPFQNRSGDSLWQNLLSQLKNRFFLKDLFSDTMWCSHVVWMYSECRGCGWFIHDCALKHVMSSELLTVPSLRIISTLVVLSAGSSGFSKSLYSAAPHLLHSVKYEQLQSGEYHQNNAEIIMLIGSRLGMYLKVWGEKKKKVQLLHLLKVLIDT